MCFSFIRSPLSIECHYTLPSQVLELTITISSNSKINVRLFSRGTILCEVPCALNVTCLLISAAAAVFLYLTDVFSIVIYSAVVENVLLFLYLYLLAVLNRFKHEENVKLVRLDQRLNMNNEILQLILREDWGMRKECPERSS